MRKWDKAQGNFAKEIRFGMLCGLHLHTIHRVGVNMYVSCMVLRVIVICMVCMMAM